eukprot:gene55-biopygen10567
MGFLRYCPGKKRDAWVSECAAPTTTTTTHTAGLSRHTSLVFYYLSRLLRPARVVHLPHHKLLQRVPVHCPECIRPRRKSGGLP